jgi:anthranilate synthase
LFVGIRGPLTVGRYHSLYALPDAIPEEIKVTAYSDDGVIMALEHRCLPIAAVQFHPESIMSLEDDGGLRLIYNAVAVLTQSRAEAGR